MNTQRLNLILLVLLAAVVLSALTVGTLPTGLGDVGRVLLGQGDAALRVVIWDIRLPRVLAAMLVGASLALSGAALQGLLRNPLADPGVIGVTASAGLGAVLALYLGVALTYVWMLPVAAIGAALIATGLLVLLAGRDASVLMLILAGVALSSFAAALTSLVISLSPNPFALGEIVLWLLGSLANRSHTDIVLAAPFMAVGGIMLLSCGRRLDALTLGEDTAATLGVNAQALRLAVVFGTALAVGASVAICGAVGFVGLVVPHILRPLVGYAPSRLLLPSALGGAILITAADLLIRVLPLAQELKLGVVTALIGAPFFLHLLWSTRRAMR